MYGRDFSSPRYRYGFNGKEKDDDLKGVGNSYDFGDRILDPRSGSWLSVDPLAKKYASWSPYSFVMDSPIFLVDPTGRDVGQNESFKKSKANQAGFKLFSETDVGKALLLKYASPNGNLLTAENPGKLSRHEVLFTTKTGGDYGQTSLKVWDESKKEFVPYSSSMEIGANTKLQINIGIDIGISNSAADQGFAAGTISHEVFAHFEELTNILEEFENSPKSADDVKKLNEKIKQWDASSTDERQHEELSEGKNAHYNDAVIQMKNVLQKKADEATDKKEKKTAEGQKEGLIQEVESDVKGGFTTIEPKKGGN